MTSSNNVGAYPKAYVIPDPKAQRDPKVLPIIAAKKWIDNQPGYPHNVYLLEHGNSPGFPNEDLEEILKQEFDKFQKNVLRASQSEDLSDESLSDYKKPVVILQHFDESTLQKVCKLPLGGLVVIPDLYEEIQEWIEEHQPEAIDPWSGFQPQN